MFLANLGVVAVEVSVHGRVAVVAEEEAGVEAVAEETGLSGVDDGRGDRWSRERRRGDRRSFGMKAKQHEGGGAIIYRLENIRSSS
jgi:hypothetical protein